jgi:hypothetical protein
LYEMVGSAFLLHNMTVCHTYPLAPLRRAFRDRHHLESTCFPIITEPSQKEASMRMKKRRPIAALAPIEKGRNGTTNIPANQTPERPIRPTPAHFFHVVISTGRLILV